MDQRFDAVPRAPGQAAADAGHVQAGPELFRKMSHLTEPNGYGVATDWGIAVFVPFDVSLPDVVGNPGMRLYLHELHFAEGEVFFRLEPLPVLPFGFLPAVGKGHHETFALATHVIANMYNDPVAWPRRLGLIFFYVLNVGWHLMNWSKCGLETLE